MTAQDVTRFRLGKLPYRDDPRTFKAAEVLASAPLTIAPSDLDWFQNFVSGMMLNDQYGDCVVACRAHQIQVHTGNALGLVTTVPNSVIKSTYLTMTGGQDTGLVMLDAMKYWKSNGLGGHKILGYALANPMDWVELKQAMLLFGGLELGLNMPRAWQSETVWDAVDGPTGMPGGWGGHAVPVSLFLEDDDTAEVFTWGYRQRITKAALAKYCDEAWAVLDPDFLVSGVAPNGFLLEELQARQAAL